jgi:nucleoid DNA-binding protein
MRLDHIGDYIEAKVPGVSKTQGEEAYKAILELIKEEANKDANAVVKLPKLGRFTVTRRDPYMGKNPSNGEPMMIPASRRVSFSAFQSLKDSLNDHESVK